MASNESNLSIVVKLIDEASSAMRSMSTSISSSLSGTSASLEQLTKTGGTAKQWQQAYTDDLAKFMAEEDKATESTKEIDKATEHHGHTLSGMVKTMVEYTVAWEAVSELQGLVKDFFSQAIEQAMQADDTMAQLSVQLKNAGLSYSELAPKIAQVAQDNIALGFADDETTASMGKLLLATGDYNQALALNRLAMDLARSKSIDLGSATALVEQVMAGNTRALKEYGISLDSAATSAQALDILQKQVGGSAEAAADTSAGKWREVQAQWQNLEQEVGEKMMPILDDLFNTFSADMPQIEALIESIVPAIKLVAGSLGLIVDSIDNVVFAAQELGSVLGNRLTVEENNAADAARANSEEHQKLADAYNKVHQSAKITADAFGGEKVNMTLLREAAKDLNAETGKTGNALDNVTNRIKGADNAMMKHSDAVAKLSTEYGKMRSSGMSALTDLTESFQTKMASINKSIGDTMLKIGELSDSYVQTQKDDTAKLADDIVASETKIADLKRQIGRASTAEEAGRLDEELNNEILNNTSSLQFRQAHADAIAAAEARAKETDIQRKIDEYNQKETLDTQAYNKKLLSLQQELIDKRKEAEQETDLYTKKMKTIAGILDKAQAYFEQLSASRIATTTKEVDAEIAQFQRLAAAQASIKSASSFLSLSNASMSIPHFADGGIVNGPTIALVGEAGPEAIIPLSSFAGGSSLPASGIGGGGGVTININGGYYLDSNGAKMIARVASDELMRILRQNQRLAV